MKIWDRRSFARTLLSLPVLAKTGLASQSPRDEEWENRYGAVKVLRFVNTAELWHMLEFGIYVGREELFSSPVIDRLRDHERASHLGDKGCASPAMSLDKEEVIPGWELRLRTTADSVGNEGAGYVVVMKSKTGERPVTFGSDESGVIHEGRMLASFLPDELPASLAELNWDPDGIDRRQGRTTGMRLVAAAKGFIRAAALFQVHIDASCITVYNCNYCHEESCLGACCFSYPACCCGFWPRCFSYRPSRYCCNIGCMDCVWCCTSA